MFAQSGTTSAAAPVNPNKKKALILGGLGAGTLAVALLKDPVGADGKLLVVSFALAGAGAAVYVIGEKKKASIGIGFVPNGVTVQQRIRF